MQDHSTIDFSSHIQRLLVLGEISSSLEDLVRSSLQAARFLCSLTKIESRESLLRSEFERFDMDKNGDWNLQVRLLALLAGSTHRSVQLNDFGLACVRNLTRFSRRWARTRSTRTRWGRSSRPKRMPPMRSRLTRSLTCTRTVVQPRWWCCSSSFESVYSTLPMILSTHRYAS